MICIHYHYRDQMQDQDLVLMEQDGTEVSQTWNPVLSGFRMSADPKCL